MSPQGGLHFYGGESAGGGRVGSGGWLGVGSPNPRSVRDGLQSSQKTRNINKSIVFWCCLCSDEYLQGLFS